VHGAVVPTPQSGVVMMSPHRPDQIVIRQMGLPLG